MKYILIIPLLFLSACSSKASKENWFNIVEENNHVVAAVNLSNGEPQYYESKDQAFRVMFKNYMELRQRVIESQKAAVPVPEEKKK